MSAQAEDFLRRKAGKNAADPRLSDLPKGPGDPRWKEHIPPPEPELEISSLDAIDRIIRIPSTGTTTSATGPSAPPINFVSAARRVVVSYGPKPGSYMISVESPQSDTIFVTVRATRAAVEQMYPVLEELGAIRNLTGASFAAFSPRQQTAESAYRRGAAGEGQRTAAGPESAGAEGDPPSE